MALRITQKKHFKDIVGFRRALRQEYRQNLPRFVNEVVVAITTRVYDGVLTFTPVDTGRARVSWLLTLGAPGTGMVDPEQSIQVPGYWIAETGIPLTAEERTTLSKTQAAIRSSSMGAVVYLVNNQPYINVLEDGWSRTKAPAGMVQVTIDWVMGDGQRHRIMQDALKALS